MPVTIDVRRCAVRIGGVDGTNAEQAFDSANHTANRAADDRADGPRRIHADSTAVGDAVRNALRLRRQRQCERYGDGGCKQNVMLHAITLSCDAMLMM